MGNREITHFIITHFLRHYCSEFHDISCTCSQKLPGCFAVDKSYGWM